MKVLKWLDEHFEETLLCILLVLIFVVELIQVAVRNLAFVPALTWAEEFCRFCWIWSVFLSLPFTIKTATSLRVTALLDIMPKKVKKAVDIAVDIITTAVMIVLAVTSVDVVNGIAETGESSPAMLWPMWIIYAVLLIGFALGAFRGIQQAIGHIKGGEA